MLLQIKLNPFTYYYLKNTLYIDYLSDGYTSLHHPYLCFIQKDYYFVSKNKLETRILIDTLEEIALSPLIKDGYKRGIKRLVLKLKKPSRRFFIK